ncbi:hypothetical protein [Pseudomonas sp. 1 R 17]|uniref:hypothetical protein n=1 Tax=Pseudomonas sp. 1 R 17 TaxID=1844091 RepID=UPI00081275C5|nr:hypothetical protein [Pseudomonas sp. 1 R 17]SAM31636.1 hypothetical protein BN1864_LIB5394:01683 [Pseudomonas sp. 1 R 17]
MNTLIEGHRTVMAKRLPEHGSSIVRSGAGMSLDGPVNAFAAAERRFGENRDCSTHVAVIKLMMMTLGPRPSDVFQQVTQAGEGYAVTMKDQYRVHVSQAELEQVTRASRFTGQDPDALKHANFMLAAFVKRKQQLGGYATFDAALAKTLEGETSKRCLEGMGVYGLSRWVAARDMVGRDLAWVRQTHDFGAALVVGGANHTHGEGYGYVLFDDRETPPQRDRGLAQVSESIRHADIWSGFYQGVEGNCVTVSAIKAAITRFPEGIYTAIYRTPAGCEVTMRDGFRLRLSHEELRQATAASNFYGSNRVLLDYANFLYACSAKRAQLENNDFRAGRSFTAALETLNDGEYPGEALQRLGLFGYIRNGTVEELVNGAIGTIADGWHSVVVVKGMLDLYGQKYALNESPWRRKTLTALKLV